MRNLSYIIAAIGFITVLGAAVYEHTSTVPFWSAAPPASLTMFQGEYAINSANFWPFIHPFNLLMLIVALVLNWRSARRKFIAITLVGYGLIIAITAIYFVPELIAITQTPYSTTVDPSLVARARIWEQLSLIRLGALILLAISLLWGLTKGNDH